VPNGKKLVELDDLEDKGRVGVEVERVARLEDAVLELEWSGVGLV